MLQLTLIQSSRKKGRDNLLRNLSIGHELLILLPNCGPLKSHRCLWGYSQVVETVGIGLCLSLVPKHVCIRRRTEHLLNKVAGQMGSGSSLAFICSNKPGPILQPQQQCLGSHVVLWHACDQTFSSFLAWALGISIYYISWVFSDPWRKDDPEVESMAGAWRTGRMNVPLYHDIFKVGYFDEMLRFLVVILLLQVSSFAWLSTSLLHPLSPLIIHNLNDLEAFCFIIYEDPNPTV